MTDLFLMKDFLSCADQKNVKKGIVGAWFLRRKTPTEAYFSPFFAKEIIIMRKALSFP